MAKRKTTVDNIRYYDRDNLPSNCVRIDRTTIFGNPYPISPSANRYDVIKRFARYFKNRIKHDVRFRNKVKQLAGKTLLCWCHPMRCHGDVYAEYLNNIKA